MSNLWSAAPRSYDLVAVGDEWRTQPTDLAGWAMRAETIRQLAVMHATDAYKLRQVLSELVGEITTPDSGWTWTTVRNAETVLKETA